MVWLKLPANVTHTPNVGLFLDHRLRRYANIKPTCGVCLLIVAGL